MKQGTLRKILSELAAVEKIVADLQKNFDASEKEKKDLTDKAEELEMKLTPAGQLVEGLSGERSRWEASIQSYKAQLTNLIGDCAIAASFLSYAGPFDSEYRQMLVSTNWHQSIKSNKLPMSQSFQFNTFLADPTDLRKWKICGLLET